MVSLPSCLSHFFLVHFLFNYTLLLSLTPSPPFFPLPFSLPLSSAQVTKSITWCLRFHRVAIRVISKDPTVANDSQKYSSDPQANSYIKGNSGREKGKELILFTGPAVLIIYTTRNSLAHRSMYCIKPDGRPLRICMQATARAKTSFVI